MKLRALLVSGFVLLAGAAVALVMVVLELRAATAPPTPEAWVGASWVVYKFGPGHRSHVGRLHLECKACHRTDDAHGFDRPGPAPCASCHEERGGLQHELVSLDAQDDVVKQGGVRELANCLACHGFGPDPDQRRDDCMACHDESHGEVKAIVTHELAKCTECHDVHQDAVKPLACTACHEQRVQHAHRDADAASQCRDCHDVHASKSFALDQCQTCHGPKGERPVPQTATFESHTCTGCHEPHAFAKSEVADCRSCHADLGMMSAHAESPCATCHEPHAVRESVRPTEPCVRCHADVKPAHGDPSHPEAGRCTGCHTPHPAAKSETPGARCTGCHSDVGGSTHAAHAQGIPCTGCHAPHSFALKGESKPLCTRCHAAELTGFAKQMAHDACNTCHTALPHGPDLTPKACASCHGDEAQGVRTGHGTCTGCHEPHTTQVAGNRCESCHADQAAHHPRGHEECTSCHVPHSGEPKPGVTDCSGCHAQAKLPGLHKVDEHAKNCQSCHTPHGATPPGERGRCLACHEDRTSHEPEAAQCNGCHTFIAPGRRSP